jgi:hypothetical protein
VRTRILPLLGLVAAVLTAALPVRAAGPDLSALGLQLYESPTPAPPFSLPDLGGRTRSLADLRGKLVLVFFWATW